MTAATPDPCATSTTRLGLALCRKVAGWMAPPPPPPPPPTPLLERGSTWALLALVLAAVALVVAYRRSERVRGRLQATVALARAHATSGNLAHWGGPVGRGALALCRAVARFVQGGHRMKGKVLRAALVALVIAAPTASGGLAVRVVARLVGLSPGLLVLLGLGVLALVALAQRGGDEDADKWWGERRLLAALRTAAVVPAAKDGDEPVVLHRRGQPQHTEHGSTVVLELPGVPWTLARDRADRLAAALRLDSDRLAVTHPDGTPTGVVSLFYGSARRAGSAPAQVGSAQRTRWSDPVRIGCDLQGQPVHLATHEANTLLAGQPGSGKTAVARTVLAHYLLDGTAQVFLLDGKGSRADYGAATALCTRFVSGVDEDAAEALEQMLAEVLDIVRTRNGAVTEPAGGWPGVLLLLEELQDVRAAADKATRERLDNLLGRIVRMGRAVGVAVLISTQRPTVDDVPAGVRNLVSQRLALMLRNGADAALVLGTTPTLPLPTRRGQALLTTPTGTVAVALDLLDGAAWAALCQRAAALRTSLPATAAEPAGLYARPVEPAVSLAKDPEPAPVEPEPEAVDPLLDAVVEVLRDADPAGMTASALHTALPEWVRPDTPARLGMALRPHLATGVAVRRAHVAKAAVIRLGVPGTGPRQVPGASPVSPRRVPGPGTPGISSPPAHAHSGPAVVRSPESPAGAR